ncbi:hypothetical protein R1sor_001205 [Riccia sorocarpa]|uniref:F-box domain-containing protein n=1 Tax=Riccia sorocarpa TaxID=122646 RepID=A0ABD3GW68_9MARC
MKKKKKPYDKIRFRRRRPRKKSVLWGKTHVIERGKYVGREILPENTVLDTEVWGRSLPNDVFCIILARLPMSSMIRFRTVCKAWYEMLKDPNYLDACSRLPPRAPSLVLKNEQTCFLYEPQTDRWMWIPDSFFQPETEAKFQVVDSKGGRILLKRHYRLLLFNPLNRCKRGFPPMLDLDHDTHDIPVANEVYVAGMYIDDFSKVLHVLVLDKKTNYEPPDEDDEGDTDDAEDGLEPFLAQTYDSVSNSWEMVGVFNPEYELSIENAALVDGFLHCLTKAIKPHMYYNRLAIYSVLRDVWDEDVIDMPEEDQELVAPRLFTHGRKQLLAAALIDKSCVRMAGDFPRWRNLIVYELRMIHPPVSQWVRILEIEPRIVQELLWHVNAEDLVFLPEGDFLYFGSRTGSSLGLIELKTFSWRSLPVFPGYTPYDARRSKTYAPFLFEPRFELVP